MVQFLEILKYILPALVVFITVYFTMRQYLGAEYNLQFLKTQQANAAHNVPIKLQAYERLILFLERIRLSNLIYRLRSTDMVAKDLTTSMLISIQKEFEHNQAQQLYVSNKLWDIIVLAKENVLSEISQTASQFQPDENAGTLGNALILAEKKKGRSGIDVAINAIKEEANIILNTN